MNEPLILDGRKIVEDLYPKLPTMKGRNLYIITVGHDSASEVYVRNKIKACDRIGMKGINLTFDESITFLDLKAEIEKLHDDENIAGIIVQHPLPKHLKNIENCIYPAFDVDGLGDYNMYNTLIGGEDGYHYPATPQGIIEMLDYYNIPIEGKNVVIINRSDIVGKPLSAMMLARNASVDVCHSKTTNLINHTMYADIIITAVGKPKWLNSEYIMYRDYETDSFVSNYPVIIDVAMCRDENGKLCGDCDFDNLLPNVSAISKVPGGVGLMTVYELIKNCTRNA